MTASSSIPPPAVPSSGQESTHEVNCPAWCSDHLARSEEYAGQVVRFDAHSADAFSIWPRHGDEWLFWLQLSRVDFTPRATAHRTAPTIILASSGSAPRAISPAEARGLAAALVRCAEVVEAELSATCAGCGRAVEPVDATECFECRMARPRLQVVVASEELANDA